MMSKEKRRVPKLRFPGFTEDWEQRKLESLFTKYEDKVNTPSSGYWRLGLRSHCKGTFHTYIDAGNELEIAEMNRVKSGNFILNITFAWERALAVTNDEDQDKLVSHRFPQFKPNNDLVIDFFKHTLTDKRFKHHLELSSPGGAGRNKVLKVADMLKYELLVPSIKEQNEISSFLNHVDYIITLHQRKLDNLKLKKKALLQKLFPKNGERYPELRFPGFTDAWEQRKLGEFVKIISGDAPSTFISGNCIYVKVDDLNYSDRIQLSSSNLVNANPKAHLVNKGATIFPKRGAAIMTNKVRIMGKDGYLDTNMMALIPEEIDKDFLFTFIQKTGLYKIADTSTIPQINNKHIEPYMIQVPSEKEQAYIGVVFEKIDKIITLHQRKLDHLQLQKKALLQQMFV